MSPFTKSISEGFATLRQTAGTTIKYQRGANWVSLKAVPGVTTFEAVTPHNTVIELRSRDYTFAAADLVLAGSMVTPVKGDQIIEDTGTAYQTYEVMRPDGGAEQVWRYQDHGQTSIRVHTKLAGAVAK
jgi:hypothetical protein